MIATELNDEWFINRIVNVHASHHMTKLINLTIMRDDVF